MTTIRVKAAVVDTKQLTLYKEDGKPYVILQGDDRLLPILTEITPILEANLIATVDLRIPEEPVDTVFADYEKETGGLTRFFRIAKSKVKHLLGIDESVARAEAPHVSPRKLGHVPGTPLNTPVIELTEKVPEPAPEPTKPLASPEMDSAISDIMKHATPVSKPGYSEKDTTEDDTIIAVTDNGKGKATVIPGVESLKGHIGHATKLKDAVGMQAFLKRLGNAIDSRDHSVADVLKFMERGDLPLADDGSIIAYKVLKTRGSDTSVFVDCHTGGVTQKVGSIVCMDIKLVDRSRSNECSYGLHIARRGYLRSFGGNIMVLCKIAPEDVIAVPHNDPNKVRVRAYHILGRVPDAEHQNLRDGKPFQTVEGQRLLTMAIKGDHAPAIQRVEIVSHTSRPGGQVVITDLVPGDFVEQAIKEDVAPTPSIPDPVAPAAAKPLNAPVVDPKALSKQLDAGKKNVPLTKAEQARVLFVAGKFTDLLAFKKAAKKSWTALGFTIEEEKSIVTTTGVATTPVPKATETIATADLNPRKGGQPTTSHTVPKATDNTTKVAKTVAASKNVVAGTDNKERPKMDGTRAEVARKLFDLAAGGDKPSWGHLWQHRKECKKSWEILGFTPKEIERIKTNKPDWV